MKLSKETRAYLRAIAAKGGSARSEAKTKAARLNAKKPRKKKTDESNH